MTDPQPTRPDPGRPETSRWTFIASATILALAIIAMVAFIALSFATDGHTQPGATTQPTIPPPPTVTALVATSSTLMAPASTTKDPDTFTTGTVAGPIQVRVPDDSPCQGMAGEGYRVTYRISNDGARKTGPVTAQLDLQPPIQVQAALILGRGQTLEAVAFVPGSGELVTVTWQSVTSFPMEVEICPPNPADERAARQLTTTTGKP